jgi:hypothetical protein
LLLHALLHHASLHQLATLHHAATLAALLGHHALLPVASVDLPRALLLLVHAPLLAHAVHPPLAVHALHHALLLHLLLLWVALVAAVVAAEAAVVAGLHGAGPGRAVGMAADHRNKSLILVPQSLVVRLQLRKGLQWGKFSP